MSNYFSLRVFLAVLLFALAIGTVVGAALQVGQGGAKTASSGCSDCEEKKAELTDDPCTSAVCRMYVYMNHGDYCSWYSLKCNNPMPPSPCSYDGFCNDPPATSPCSLPCTGCTPVGRREKGGLSIALKAHVNGGLKKGFKNKKQKAKGDFRSGAASSNEDGNVLKFDLDGTTVYVQLWDVSVTDSLTFHVGHEINNPGGTNIEDADTVEQDDDHVYLITHSFPSGDQYTYTVILHKDTVVPMP